MTTEAPLKLPRTAQAWGTPEFEAMFQTELEAAGAARLPLRHALTLSNAVADSPIKVMLLAAAESAASLHLKAGVFYQGILAGCSCADDPTPVNEQTEYCELELEIQKASAVTAIRLCALNET